MTAPGGRQMHDLIRDFARALAVEDGPDDNREGVTRVLAYYHQAALLIDVPFTRQPPPPAIESVPSPVAPRLGDLEATVTWAHRERENLIACADYLVSDNGVLDAGERAAWTIRFASALAGLLRNDGLWAESIELQGRAIEAAVELGRPLAEANARHERAFLGRLTGRLEIAEADLLAAIALCDDNLPTADVDAERSWKRAKAHALGTFAVVIDQRHRNVEAKRAWAEAHEIYTDLGDDLGLANLLHDTGMEHFNANPPRYPQAIQLVQQALDLYAKVGQPLGMAHANRYLSESKQKSGDSEGAARNWSVARALYQQLGNKLGEAGTFSGPNATLSDLIRMWHAQSRVGTPLDQANVLKELAVRYAAAGDRQLSQDLLWRAWRVLRKAGNDRDDEKPLHELERLGLRLPPEGEDGYEGRQAPEVALRDEWERLNGEGA